MSTTNNGRFDWFEYMTGDVNKAKAFYSELFNWKVEEKAMPQADGSTYTYAMFCANGKPVAGMSAPDHASLANSWLAYTTVANLDNAVKTLQKNGGKVLCAETSLPNIGRWVVATDAQGIAFSPFQSACANCAAPSEMATGQFCWHEISTSNPEQALALYTEMFGWQKGELITSPDGSKYQVLNRVGEERGFGGVFAADEKSKPTWRHYVAVESVDETLARANSLGGKTVWPAMDIGANGRIACFTDNQGAELAIWSAK